jgi:hypothetical protein
MTLRVNLTNIFQDPISLERMTDPVINSTCGHSYEAEQINGWVASRIEINAIPDCPLCRAPIGQLIANILLKQGLEILDAQVNSLAVRLEDLPDEEREDLERAIAHVQQRRLANQMNNPPIPDRLSEALTFVRKRAEATVRVYC